MTDLRTAARAALWAFQCHVEQTWPTDRSTAAIAALKAALAQQDEPVEPVAWMYTGIKQDGTEHGPHLVWKPKYMDAMSASKGAKATPLYAAPPQRKPLTEDVAALTAQRDALLEALKKMRIKYGEYACRMCDQADAAIKAVEETK